MHCRARANRAAGVASKRRRTHSGRQLAERGPWAACSLLLFVSAMAGGNICDSEVRLSDEIPKRLSGPVAIRFDCKTPRGYDDADRYRVWIHSSESLAYVDPVK